MGDVVGLVEDVQRQVDAKAVENIAGKVKRGRKLDLEDFKTQLEQIRNMGGMESLLDKVPGLPSLPAAADSLNDQGLRRQIGIIDSMTRRERRRPELIKGSRKRRIAAGAGRPVQEVSHLLKQHRQLAKTMKRVSRGGLQGLFEGLQSPVGGIPAGKRRGGPGGPRR
jgi:signal recognition particle subunit SRP54